jgi:hypothetical protein
VEAEEECFAGEEAAGGGSCPAGLQAVKTSAAAKISGFPELCIHRLREGKGSVMIAERNRLEEGAEGEGSGVPVTQVADRLQISPSRLQIELALGAMGAAGKGPMPGPVGAIERVVPDLEAPAIKIGIRRTE